MNKDYYKEENISPKLSQAIFMIKEIRRMSDEDIKSWNIDQITSKYEELTNKEEE